jgi:hypothetical protein
MKKKTELPAGSRNLVGVRTLLACTFWLGASSTAEAAITHTVSFVDPGSLNSSYYSAIYSHVGASLTDWGSRLAGSADVAVEVAFTNAIPRATGGSVTSGFVQTSGGYNIFEQGMAYELRTGLDPNDTSPDVRITFNPDYLASLWFEADPYSRVGTIPVNRTDAMSVFLHEFGHALAFNGWESSTGTLPSNYASPWDMNTVYDGTTLAFYGMSSMAVYGGAVPVTSGNNFHIGNAAPGPGSDLVPDLMNGVVFYYGTRYQISELDVAMLQDMGVQTVPLPGAIWLLLSGVGGLCAMARVRRQSGIAGA